MHGIVKLPSSAGIPAGSPGAAGEGEAGFDVRRLLSTVLLRWKIIAGAMAITLLLALVWLLQVTPLYTAATQVLLDHRKQKMLRSEAVISDLALDASTIATEVSLVRSFAIARRVAEQLKLAGDAEFANGDGGAAFFGNIREVLFSGGGKGKDKAPAKTAKEAAEQRDNAVDPGDLAAIYGVLGGIEVRRLAATYFIEISYTHPHPKVAAKVANAMAEAYLVEQLEARYQAAKRAAGWLSERLATVRLQLETSERTLADHRAQHNLVNPAEGSLTQQQAAQINAQLVAAHADAVQKLAKYEQARGILDGGKIESVAEVMQSPAIAALRQQEAEASRQESDLLTRYGPQHPAVIKIRDQRGAFRRQINAELSRVVSTLRTDYEFALKKEQSLEASLRDLSGVDKRNDQAVIRLRELERQAQANRVLYESLLTRFKEAEQHSSLPAAESRIIAPALEPGSPSYPNKQRILILAIIGGLMLGFGAALLLEFIENGFSSIEQVEQALQLPVLAMVAQLPGRERQIQGHTVSMAEYVVHKPLARFSESIRSVRVSAQMSNIDEPPRLILVTSAVPSEGKTTISHSLAYSAAAASQRVLLIDCDLRHPSLSKQFNLADGPGLTDLLTGQAPAEQVFRKGPLAHMTIISAGTLTKHPPDILGSEKLRLLLEAMRDQYDVVILDAPPVTPVIDSVLLSRHADKILFVVKWRTTPRDIVARAVSQLDDPRKKIAGIVLNNIQLGGLAGYAPNYSYYHKRYQKYYAQ